MWCVFSFHVWIDCSVFFSVESAIFGQFGGTRAGVFGGVLLVWTLSLLRRTPKMLLSVFSSPAPISFFLLSLSSVLLVEFWLVFLKVGTLKCAWRSRARRVKPWRPHRPPPLKIGFFWEGESSFEVRGEEVTTSQIQTPSTLETGVGGSIQFCRFEISHRRRHICAWLTEAGIRVNPGKTKIWNSAGVKPPGCNVLQMVAETFDPTAVVTRVVEPGATHDFCDRNDVALWQCLSWIMLIPTTQTRRRQGNCIHANFVWRIGVQERQTDEPISLWTSWADCLPNPRIAALFVAHLSGQPHTPFLRAASEATFHFARDPFGTLSHVVLDQGPGSRRD